MKFRLVGIESDQRDGTLVVCFELNFHFYLNSFLRKEILVPGPYCTNFFFFDAACSSVSCLDPHLFYANKN